MPFELRWLSFDEARAAITALRRAVFVEEQGLGEHMVETARDADGLHLAAIDGGRIVAALSAYVLRDGDPARAALGLETMDDAAPGGVVAQLTKRAVLPEARGAGLSELVIAAAWREIDEVFSPDAYAAVLIGPHVALAGAYARDWGLAPHREVSGEHGRAVILAARGAAALRRQYALASRRARARAASLGAPIPSLVRALAARGRIEAAARARLEAENNYLEPLSLKDELPRLAAQARVVAIEQRARLAAVAFPKAPARLLDLGCGPGLAFESLEACPGLRGYALHGADASKELVATARLSSPRAELRVASAYATGYDAASFDVVRASFLFIHLTSPDLALREIARILRPGGVLYVVDVNDATFDGPAPIRRLVERHGEVHRGDRCVLETLPARAGQLGLRLARSWSTPVSNRGAEGEPARTEGGVAIGRMVMWGLFSFLGQRAETEDAFAEAERCYFEARPDVAVAVQTHVYVRDEAAS